VSWKRLEKEAKKQSANQCIDLFRWKKKVPLCLANLSTTLKKTLKGMPHIHGAVNPPALRVSMMAKTPDNPSSDSLGMIEQSQNPLGKNIQWWGSVGILMLLGSMYSPL
jgi:hypothetical protein